MCGFAGILETTGRAPSEVALRRFAALLAHRGPDGEGIAVDGPAGLAHRRLSILDLSEAAHQPMWDEERRACLAYNGEIYNFREIRTELERAGWTFHSTGDTEVLLKACLHWGVPAAAERVNGMFALALWDRRERRLWLARDRMGIKPLFYSHHAGRVLFGSEIKPILEYRAAEPDRITLLDVLAGGAPHWGRHTLFEGVESVEPGEWLCFSEAGDLRRDHYFRLLDQVDPSRYREAERTPAVELTGTLRELLERSVTMHMVSDAPVAVLASGGLDSSLIAALSLSGNQNLDLYHADVVGPDSEASAAAELARHLELRLYTAPIEGEQYVRDLAAVAYYNECPSGYHPNDVPFHIVSGLAADRGIKVLLTGEGADELFQGYAFMMWAIGQRTMARVGDRARRALLRLPGGRHFLNLVRPADPLPAMLLRRGEEAALRTAARERCAFIAGEEDREVLVEALVYCSAHLQSLLHRNDRMGMMESLESRIPFLENELVRFAVNLPRRFKVPRHPLRPGPGHPMSQNKWLLRQVAAQILPAELSRRKKMGFPVTPEAYLDLSPAFFREGFLQGTLRIGEPVWSSLWEQGGEEFQWNAFAAEIWGRIFFLGEPHERVAERLLSISRLPATSKAVLSG